MNKLTYIDDCQLDRFILQKILSKFGSQYEVKCTDTGNDVLNLLTQYEMGMSNLPDTILLDIYIPDFDAWAFLDRMERIYPTLMNPVEVYILSASSYGPDIERIKQYSCVKAFILKPITKEALQKLIRHKITPMNNFEAIGAYN